MSKKYLYEKLEDFIFNNLIKKENYTLKEVTLELLLIITKMTSDEKFILTNYFEESSQYNHSKNEILDSNEDINYKKLKNFKKSKLVENFQDIKYNKIYNLEKIEQYESALHLREKLILSCKELIINYKKDFTNLNELEYYLYDIDSEIEKIFKIYTVLLNKEKIVNIYNKSIELSKITDNKMFNLDLIKYNFKKYLLVMEDMKKIYNFLKDNNNFQQKKIFAKLSIDGRKIYPLIVEAEKFKMIKRTKYKDTWLLEYIGKD